MEIDILKKRNDFKNGISSHLNFEDEELQKSNFKLAQKLKLNDVIVECDDCILTDCVLLPKLHLTSSSNILSNRNNNVII